MGLNIDKVYVGSSYLDKIYIGAELVYQNQKGIPIEGAPNGIYVLRTTDNLLYTQEDWNTDWNEEAVGVGVVSSNCKFVISKIHGGLMTWGDEDVIINGVTIADDSDTARMDYAGKDNTDKIIAQLGASNAPASNYCKNTNGLFPDGRQGYLGAFGEWMTAYDNKKEVDTCMSLIGGEAISSSISDGHFSSTQSSKTGTVWVLYWGNNQIASNYKELNSPVRAFAPLT